MIIEKKPLVYGMGNAIYQIFCYEDKTDLSHQDPFSAISSDRGTPRNAAAFSMVLSDMFSH